MIIAIPGICPSDHHKIFYLYPAMDYFNLIKTVSSYTISSGLKKPVMYGLPLAISLELTNHCNLHCPECPSGNGLMTRKKGFMDTGLFRKIIGELRPYLINVNLYFQGEPMLHSEFYQMLGIASDIKTTVSTNGHFLDPESCEKLALSGLNKIIISLDGFDEKTYSAYRKNGDFSKVIEGIRNISKSVKKNHSSLKVIIQVLVNRYNENQLTEIRRFAAVNGAELALKSMQIYNDKKSWLPSSEIFRRYESVDERYRIKGKLPQMCARLWFNPVVTWDGKVLPCCFDKDAAHIMGDMNCDSLKNIWYGKEYMEFRKMLLEERENIVICRNCTSGLRGVKV